MDNHEPPFEQFPGSDADMFIQWKGTDVCVDFHCPCQPKEKGYAAHFDGFFAYYLKCPACGSVYEMGTQVRARKLPEVEARDVLTQTLDMAED